MLDINLLFPGHQILYSLMGSLLANIVTGIIAWKWRGRKADRHLADTKADMSAQSDKNLAAVKATMQSDRDKASEVRAGLQSQIDALRTTFDARITDAVNAIRPPSQSTVNVTVNNYSPSAQTGWDGLSDTDRAILERVYDDWFAGVDRIPGESLQLAWRFATEDIIMTLHSQADAATDSLDS